jgi:2-(1,2-epoxy-1,2-dihydrophenyl)acetyl-CoA isomerase
LNRPQQLNCWDTKLNHELFGALEDVMDDPKIRFIVFTGAGRSFCAGGDIDEFNQRIAIDAQAYISEIVRKSHEIVLQVRKIGKLTIAAVNGLAAGSGFNLTLACDFKIAVRSAKFSQRFVRVGLSPDTGGTYFLPQLVGLTRATEILMTGDFITADRALDLGLINHVVEEGGLEQATDEWIEKLSKSAYPALIHTKRLINQSCLSELATQLEAERAAMVASSATSDFKEGVSAFLEKRPAQFTGA